MNSENIQLAQMDIIRQVLNVSDMNILERIKTFLVNSKEGDDVYAKNNRISVKLQKILMKLVKNIRMVRLFIFRVQQMLSNGWNLYEIPDRFF